MEAEKDRWGIYDTKDKCWVGASSANGPTVHEGTVRGVSARDRARCAATIINEQFGEHIRFRALPIPDEVFKLKDQVESKFTAQEAMERLKV